MGRLVESPATPLSGGGAVIARRTAAWPARADDPPRLMGPGIDGRIDDPD